MSLKKNFFEQLIELRTSLIKSLLIFIAFFVVLIPFSGDIYIFFSDPLLQKLLVSDGSIISTKLSATFLVPFKITALVAFILSYPIIFFQIWSFVSPGLYNKEKNFIYLIFLLSFVLFIVAGLFVYFFVFPVIFNFFIGMTPEDVTLSIDITSYLEMIIALFLAFGIAFQIPLIVNALVKFGIVKLEFFKRNRSYFFVLTFIFGAIFTPPDILSQLLLALPVYALYELGIFIAKKASTN